MVGDAEDLSSWRERFRRYAIRDLKNQDIADIFLEDGVYPEYDEPEQDFDAYAQGGFARDAAKLRYSLELTEYYDNVKTLTKARKKLFSTMLGQICTNSQKEIAKAAGWAEAVRDHDVMELLRRIVATHGVPQSTDPGQQKLDARDKYNNCRQRGFEDTADYFTRFNECLRMLRAVDAQVPDEDQQALDFFSRLDESKYGDCKHDYRNRANKAETQLQNLEQAYQLATEYVPRKAVRRFDVYAAMADNGGRGRGRQANGGRGVGGRGGRYGGRGGSTKRWGTCHGCGKEGHFKRDCPDVKEAIEEEKKEESKATEKKKSSKTIAITMPFDILDAHDHELAGTDVCEACDTTTVEVSKMKKISVSKAVQEAADGKLLGVHDVCLDTGAGAGVYMSVLHLDGVRESDEITGISGINGSDSGLICEQMGDSLFGPAYYHPECTINVLSYSAVRDFAHKCYQREDEDFFRVQLTKDGDTYVFRRRHEIYVHNMKDEYDIIRNKPVYVTTVEQNKSYFTKKEIKRAEGAREFARKMVNPSNAVLKSIIRDGRMTGIPFTQRDIDNAEFIWGRSLANIKGKSTSHKAIAVEVESVERPISVKQVFMVDLMFVEKIPFLISVTKPINLLQVNKLKNRTVGSIFQQISKQLAVFRSRGFQITKVRCDPECGLVGLQPLLGDKGYEMDITGQEEAVPPVERAIRTIKERVRGTIHTLPFRLPLRFMQYLIFLVVLRLNMTPMASGYESSFEQVYGRKLDYKRNLKASFGEYVQAHRNKVDNSMETRADGGIALYDSGNIEGSWYVYNLNTDRLIKRNRLDILPMPEIVIDHMNRMCADENHIRGTEPIFEVGALRRVVEAGAEEYYDEAAELRKRVDAIGKNYFRPDNGGGLDNDPVAEGFIEEPDDDGIPPGITDEQLRDYHVNEAVFDEDATVPDIDFDADDAEVWKSIDDDLSDDETVSDDGHRDNDAEDSAFNDIRGQISDMESEDEDTPADEGTYNIGGHQLRDRSKVKKRREFGLHLSVEAAIQKLGKAAIKSIVKEMYQLEKKSVFEAVNWKQLSLQERKKLVGTRMFLKEKFKADGTFEKLKSRLVAQQFKHLVHSDGPASPTAVTTSILLMAGLAARERRAVATVDFPGAYLNAVMKGTVTVKLNSQLSSILCEINSEYENYLCDDGTLLLKLKKALYGCVESARLWYETLREQLESLGFTMNPYDACVFNRSEKDGTQTSLVVHVDDMFVSAGSELHIDALITELDGLFDAVSCERGKVLNYLGMVFDFNDDGKVKVSMNKFIDDLLEEYKNVTGTAKTPAGEDLFDIDESATLLGKEDMEYFHSLVAKLLYGSKRVRADILTAVSFLCTRVMKPTTQDMEKVHRVVKYLRYTRLLLLTIDMTTSMNIMAFIDASFGVHHDMKSHTGVAIIIGQGLLYGKSTKQKLNSKSSTEAELIGVSDGLNPVLWMRLFLIAQGYNMEPIDLRQDNQSTIKMIKSGKTNSEKSRHIAIRFYFITDNVTRGEIKVSYTPTTDMIADLFTKPLQGKLFIKLRNLLLNITD